MSDFKPRAIAYCPVCGRYVPFEKPRLAKVVYEKSLYSRGGIGTCQGLIGWVNWNPPKLWVPGNGGLGMAKVFDMVNEIYGEDFYRYK